MVMNGPALRLASASSRRSITVALSGLLLEALNYYTALLERTRMSINLLRDEPLERYLLSWRYSCAIRGALPLGSRI
jgi:hypothetical protein